MKPNLLIASAFLLLLAGCLPAEYTEAEAPKDLKLDNASAHYTLRFVPGSNRLTAGDAARLRAMAAGGALAPSDRVLVAVSGSPPLAAARFDAVAAELLRHGIVASPRLLAAVPPNHAVIESERYLVTLPECPNWSKFPSVRYANAHSSNFGCANAVNLGISVASPADLVEGRPVGMAEGRPAAAAVNRFLSDRIQLPAAAAIGPIAAPSAAAPGAAGGTSGSEP